MSEAKAKLFRELHAGPRLLVLPNAWDAISAAVVERAGATAVATTSAGVAQSLGYPDGNRVPRELVVAAVARIAAAVRVPVSADIEEGYGHSPDEAADTAEAIWNAGAVGINLEDGAEPPELLCDKIRAIRERVLPLFVNARADVYLHRLVERDRRVEETIRRGNLYREAGADSFFAPALTRPDEISAVVGGVPIPLNLLLLPGLPGPDELTGLGVRRLSAGSGLMRACMGLLQRSARDLLAGERYASPDEGELSYAELNALLAPED